ncbi:GEVED domain-containing protein [Urechidicola vernalis]|uniref:GEVED domain-containing protein n=1 Tax=Urechidicola vernalis TaxID=3075600 RepID=A0ABU2Y706_9FLAO|nr:GEVED domain-containing protein [Urechidicola sp. P050]MDT0553601.1 GEVED domain-containing protein [Urechidicola sp. P050]
MYHVFVWIDWNQDGDFNDSNEEYDLGSTEDSSNGPTTLSPLTIVVPIGAVVGTTRMRVSSRYDEDPNNCDDEIWYGEVEDYSLEISAATSPIIDIVGSGNTMSNGQTSISTLDDTDFGSFFIENGTVTHTFTIENNGASDLTGIIVSISGDTGDFSLDTSLTAATVSASGSTNFTIEFDPTIIGTRAAQISIASNDSDRNPYTFNVEGEGSTYCTSYGDTEYDTGISNVIFNTISNASDLSLNAYSDFTNISTDVNRGSTHDLTINLNTDGNYSLFAMVWIDWNQDGDFDDAGEEYDLGLASDVDNGPTSLSPLSIVVPVDAVLGSTLMRISSKWDGSEDNDGAEDSPPTSCEVDFDGEVEDYTLNIIESVPMIDFDGIDDYVDFLDNFNLTGSFSIEAWILQENTIANGTIVSKGDFDSSDGSKSYGYVLAVENGIITFKTFNNGGQSTVELSASPYSITNNKWHHVAVSYDGTNSSLFVDGILLDTDGTNSSLMNNSENFFIGAYYDSDSANPINYFNGFIDEVKIWNVGLTQVQIQEMMNQEIEKNGDYVVAKVTSKDISDNLEWSNLIGYYNFNDNMASDSSESEIDGSPLNITTNQSQTAPIPYYTMQDGDWDATDSSTPWQYGETVWNIPNSIGIDGSSEIEWNTVRVLHNLSVNRNLYLGSLISESSALVTDEEITDSELTIGADGNDYELNISTYLKLDGKIDLQNESQLIQREGSWLDTNSSGYVERDRQGTANSFTYNYWSAPVSLRNTTQNNAAFKIGDVLRDGHQGGDVINTLSFNANAYFADGAASNPRKLSTYWLYRFVSNQDNSYANWEWVGNTHNFNPTEGYTMKGTSGSGSIDMSVEAESYVFRGKPNNVLNGDTELVHTTFSASFDSNGNPRISLAGNPFPSAIDANEFIDDNINSINGQLYFWEHWGGGSHRLSDYQGGYAIYTKSGGTPAPSHPDISQVGSGTKTPSRYIPVGQGFYVIQKYDYDGDTEVVSNPQGGNVVFTNNQRVFKTEKSGESIFTKSNSKKVNSKLKETKDSIQRIRLGFKSSEGFYRSNMIAFLEGASDQFDYGYDAVSGDVMKSDLFFLGEKGYQVIQAYRDFNVKREIPISVIVDENNQDTSQTISLESIENFGEDIEVYLKDLENNGETYDLLNDDFKVKLDAGIHKSRFSIVFQSKLLELESVPNVDDTVILFMNNEQSHIQIEKLADIDIKQAILHNSIGQSISIWNSDLDERNMQLPVNVSTGVYVISLDTEVGIISKKIVVK